MCEEVYESGEVIDDNCSLFDDDQWYESGDLLIAADISKSLVSRNRNVERKLRAQMRKQAEYKLEVELLKKQIVALRDINESKMQMFIEADKHYQELEQENKILLNKLAFATDSLEKIKDKNKILETKNTELEAKVIHLEAFRTVGLESITDNAASDCNIHASSESKDDITLVDDNVTLEDLKWKDKRIHELENLTASLECVQKTSFTQISEYCELIKRLEAERDEMAVQLLSLSAQKNSNLVEIDLENDCQDFIEDGEMGILQDGTPILSSPKTLQSLGAVASNQSQTSRKSLLKELEEKYEFLVSEYEDLISTKKLQTDSSDSYSSGLSTPTPSLLEFQASLSKIFSSKATNERKRLISTDYKPQYKELFRYAFGILKEHQKDTKLV